jgi:phospholipid transport system substrate-binding protein
MCSSLALGLVIHTSRRWHRRCVGSRSLHMRSLFVVAVTSVVLGVILFAGRSEATPTDELRLQVTRIFEVLGDQAAVRQIVEQIFDFEDSARRALGPYWTERTPSERAQFIALFAGLIEQMYVSRFEMYRDDHINYLGESIVRDRATVRTMVVPKRGAEMPVDYRMHLQSGRWQVYDVVIDGVSLVENYRIQFAKVIRTSSYAELVAKIKDTGVGSQTRPSDRHR